MSIAFVKEKCWLPEGEDSSVQNACPINLGVVFQPFPAARTCSVRHLGLWERHDKDAPRFEEICKGKLTSDPRGSEA